MLLLLVACHLPSEREPDDTHADDSIAAPPDDSAAPAGATYTCVPLDQEATKGKAPVASGYEYCSLGDGTLGYTHRVGVIDAAIDPATIAASPQCGDYPGSCDDNDDCAPGSVCLADQWGDCRCIPKCRTDEDCGLGNACVPHVLDGPDGAGGLNNLNDCVPASCLSDADCPSGPCVAALDICGYHRVSSFRCWTELDECHVIADCPDAGNRDICTWMTDRFACTGKATCD
jgi:hypothetical protein